MQLLIETHGNICSDCMHCLICNFSSFLHGHCHINIIQEFIIQFVYCSFVRRHLQGGKQEPAINLFKRKVTQYF